MSPPLPSIDDALRLCDRAGERITRQRRTRGYSRVVARSAWWNVFHLAAILAWSGLLCSEQGGELLRVATGGLDRTVSPLLFLCIVVFGLAVAVSAFVVAQAGSQALREIAQSYQIDAARAESICQVWAPIVLCCAPALLLAVVCASPAWLIATGVLVALGLVALHLARRYDSLAQGVHKYLQGAREYLQGASTYMQGTHKYVQGATKYLHGARRQIERLRLLRVLIVSGFVVIVALTVTMAVSPAAARQVGTLGVALLALGAWSVMLTLTFVALPIRVRMSSLALLVPGAWLVASWLGDPNQFPRRPLDPASLEARAAALPVPAPTPLREALGQWLLQFEDSHRARQIPVYLISAEGGGIRAAYWTARVLTEMDARTHGEFGRHTFLLSGVSGGSLGITAFAGARLHDQRTPQQRVRDLETFLGRDYLSPLVARLLVTEPLWQLFRRGVAPRDRAFEQQFAADWASVFDRDPFFGQPFLQALKLGKGSRAPVVMLNATNVEYGKRFVLSNLDLDTPVDDRYVAFQRTEPLAGTLADLSVAEAVHLSARFPFVSPPASVMGLVADKERGTVERVWGQVVDGGYFDNSGASSVEDVLDTLLAYRDHALRSAGPASAGPAPSDARPTDGLVDLDRLRPLLRHVTFHVIVIRNDPLAARDGEPDVPTLRPYLDGDGGTPGLPADLTEGNLAPHLPSRIAFNELRGPPAAFFAAREARGIASRASLRQKVTQAAQAAQARCARKGLDGAADQEATTVSAACVRSADAFSEVSLAVELQHAADERHFGKQPACANLPMRKEFALGWMLAAQTQRLLSCVAEASNKLDDVLEPLGPLQPPGVAPVARN